MCPGARKTNLAGKMCEDSGLESAPIPCLVVTGSCTNPEREQENFPSALGIGATPMSKRSLNQFGTGRIVSTRLLLGDRLRGRRSLKSHFRCRVCPNGNSLGHDLLLTVLLDFGLEVVVVGRVGLERRSHELPRLRDRSG